MTVEIQKIGEAGEVMERERVMVEGGLTDGKASTRAKMQSRIRFMGMEARSFEVMPDGTLRQLYLNI